KESALHMESELKPVRSRELLVHMVRSWPVVSHTDIYPQGLAMKGTPERRKPGQGQILTFLGSCGRSELVGQPISELCPCSYIPWNVGSVQRSRVNTSCLYGSCSMSHIQGAKRY
ncbi:hypothetical protein H1C71_040764, partial [Ictidomys tridecemlineatus]